jgi:hypothetical protein
MTCLGKGRRRGKGPGLKPILGRTLLRWTDVQLPPAKAGGSHLGKKTASHPSPPFVGWSGLPIQHSRDEVGGAVDGAGGAKALADYC